MIWFDLVTPKSVMFFRPFIAKIKERGYDVLVTAREGDGYKEVVDLLTLYRIDFINRGFFGGANLGDKLKASIHRQLALMEYIEKRNITKLVCLCSVDANRVAFGLGVPIINFFYDIPLSDHTANFKKKHFHKPDLHSLYPQKHSDHIWCLRQYLSVSLWRLIRYTAINS